MPILVGIDGTGSAVSPGAERDREYDVAFADSFVRRLCFPNTTNRRYFRGPVAGGGGLPEAINGGYDFIFRRHRESENEPILLTGYSRGGLGVVVIADRLKQQNISVAAMLLFDCVDRHAAFDGRRIPNNVAYVHHVRRDPASRSRRSFGNDGTAYTPPTIYTQKFYMCTHGGMGGTPWQPKAGQLANDFIDEGYAEGAVNAGLLGALFYRTNITFAQDKSESQKIWTDVQPFMRTHRFV